MKILDRLLEIQAIYLLSFYFLFYIHQPLFYILFLVYLYLYVYIIFYFQKKIKKTGQLSDLGRKDKMQTIHDIINGIKDINIFKRYDYYLQKFKLSNITLEKFKQKNLIISRFPFYYLEFFGVLIVVSFFFFLSSQNINTTEILISISILAYGGIRIIGLTRTSISNLNFCKTSSFVIGVLFDEFNEKSYYEKKIIT